jgi:hypothetical protein
MKNIAIRVLAILILGTAFGCSIFTLVGFFVMQGSNSNHSLLLFSGMGLFIGFLCAVFALAMNHAELSSKSLAR